MEPASHAVGLPPSPAVLPPGPAASGDLCRMRNRRASRRIEMST